MITLMLLGAVAHADAVGPPAEGCPAGARGTSDHGGQYCTTEPVCEDTCDDDRQCSSTSLCVLEEERTCGGNSSSNDDCTYTYIEVTGTCSGGGSCDVGTCVVADRCVEPKLGLGCTTTGAPSALVAGLGVLLLLGAGRSRRADPDSQS